MKILLTIENLRELAGSKQWVRNLANTYARSFGYEVTVAARSGITGPMRDERWIDTIEFTSFEDVSDAATFDYALFTPHTAKLLHDRIQENIKVTGNVVHGIVKEEEPIADCDILFFVSEEARHRWSRKELKTLHKPWQVINNPIDLTEFQVAPGYRDSVTRISHFSNYDDLPGLSEFCEDRGIKFHRLKHVPFGEARHWLENSELVFATDRCAYEAMLCGAEVVFADNRNYNGGPLSDGMASKSYCSAIYSNCSGRVFRGEVNRQLYEWCVDRYHPMSGAFNRAIITENHNALRIAQSIINAFDLHEKGIIG